MQNSTPDTTLASVSENKFNGTAVYSVGGVPDADHAKAAARRFWKEEYGHSPSRVVAEQDRGGSTWTVVVSDHSSGSLKNGKDIEL